MLWLDILSFVVNIATLIACIMTIRICLKAMRRGGDDK